MPNAPAHPDPAAPVLIGIDWGSSNLRVALIDGQGRLLARRDSAAGVFTVQDGAFAAALWPLCADWLAAHPVPLLACGMVGSRQGLLEVPYLPCPAGLAELAPALGRATLAPPSGQPGAALTLHIVAGLVAGSANTGWDVMRGEETQLLGGVPGGVTDGVPRGAADGVADGGASAPAGRAARNAAGSGQLTVMPGTHSKWVQRAPDGRIQAFQTYLTGELFELLSRHSSLAKVMATPQPSPEAFALGLQQAQDQSLDNLLFRVRTAGLMGQLPAHALPDYLSGLLIGAEVRSGLQRFAAVPAVPVVPAAPAVAAWPDSRPITLVGSTALTGRYQQALALWGCSVRQASADAAFAGLLAIARAAGLVPPPAPA